MTRKNPAFSLFLLPANTCGRWWWWVVGSCARVSGTYFCRSDARLRNLFLSVEVGVQFLSVEVGVQTRAAPTRVSGTFGSGLTPTRAPSTRARPSVSPSQNPRASCHIRRAKPLCVLPRSSSFARTASKQSCFVAQQQQDEIKPCGLVLPGLVS